MHSTIRAQKHRTAINKIPGCLARPVKAPSFNCAYNEITHITNSTTLFDNIFTFDFQIQTIDVKPFVWFFYTASYCCHGCAG